LATDGLTTKEINNNIISYLPKIPVFNIRQNHYFLRTLWRTSWFYGSDVSVKHVRTTDEKISHWLFRKRQFLKAAPNAISPALYFEVKDSNQYFLVSE
jgi:hypothetical protein